MEPQELRIVLAEDDDGHATLIRRNMERVSPGANVTRFRDGYSVLQYLRAELSKGGAQPPTLLLLDIRMAGIDGTEVLREMKNDPLLRAVPVYMLTTTDNPAEVNRCFELGCNAYLTKPVSYEAFVASLERLCAFLEISKLPVKPSGLKHASA